MSNSVVQVLFFLTFVAVVSVLLYFRLSFSERTVLKGRVRLLQFLLGVVLPPIVLIPIFQLYRMLERQPFYPAVPLGDETILFIIFSLMALMSVGNGMHVAGVSIDYKAQNLDKLDEEERSLLRVIEFFHFGFSHLLVYTPLLIMVFVFFLMELNHPSPVFIDLSGLWALLLSGLIFGIGSGIGVLDGGGAKVYLAVGASFSILMVFLLSLFQISIFLMPASIFFLTSFVSGIGFLTIWRLCNHGFPEIVGELRVKDGHPQSPAARNRRRLPATKVGA